LADENTFRGENKESRKSGKDPKETPRRGEQCMRGTPEKKGGGWGQERGEISCIIKKKKKQKGKVILNIPFKGKYSKDLLGGEKGKKKELEAKGGGHNN